MKQVRRSPKSAILQSAIGNFDHPLPIWSSFLLGMVVARFDYSAIISLPSTPVQFEENAHGDKCIVTKSSKERNTTYCMFLVFLIRTFNFFLARRPQYLTAKYSSADFYL